MTRLPRLLPLVMCTLLLDAGAAPEPPGPTYRSIGPDGKITYSDRKPTDPSLRSHELGRTTSAPLVAQATGPFDLRPSSKPSTERPVVGEGQAPAVDISGKPFPPGLADAVLTVLVHQFFVQSLVETCTRLRPAFVERYQGGVRNWRDRNADILARSNRITFARFTGEQRDTLRATARQRLATVMPPPGAGEAERGTWCDRMSTDLATHQFELVGDMRIAPLLYVELP
ncbi:MAG: hypothetical protein JF586_06960 [Burkholderiales bacterium]|nr:hypothetical protein [Burkholderiales bacterium]